MAKQTENAAAQTEKKTRKPIKKTAHTPADVVCLEVGGLQYDCAAIVAQAKADYRAAHKVGIHSCKVYIKPEEQAAYYVINKVEGKVAIAPLDPA